MVSDDKKKQKERARAAERERLARAAEKARARAFVSASASAPDPAPPPPSLAPPPPGGDPDGDLVCTGDLPDASASASASASAPDPAAPLPSLPPSPPPPSPTPPPPGGDPDWDLVCTGDLPDPDLYLKDIWIHNLTVALNGEDLITNAALILQYGSCYGIVNSAAIEGGVLFRAMAQGLLPFPTYYDLSCPVYMPEYGSRSVRKYVTSSGRAKEKIELGQATLATLKAGDSEAMKCLSERLEALEESPDDFAAQILYGLGFDTQMQSGRADSLHTSWQKPLALARTLFLRPHVILLDEPTEYLDLERCVWLAEWIFGNLSKKCIVIIKSNDEAFLNQVCTDVLQIRHYDEFFQSELESNAGVRSDILRFRNRPPDRQLTPPIIQLTDVSVEYEDKPVFQKVTFDVTLSSRVAIVGNKESGKSVLMDVLSGTGNVNIKMAGTLNCNSNLSIGHFHPSLIDELDLSLSAMEHLNRASQGNRKLINEVIEFVQPATLRKPMKSLSHGQKTVICLACLAIKGPDILLLDEPFKGLNVETMGCIASALVNWNGAYVLATNNVKLIDLLCPEIWFCGSLELSKFKGGIMDLERQIKEDKSRMAKLQNPTFISGSYPQFAVASGDVAHPAVWYQEYIDDFNERFKSGCILLTEFMKTRAMVSNAPCSGLKKGDMDFPHEHDQNKIYRLTNDTGKRIGRSLLGTIYYSELAGECFGDFDISNIMVTPHGTIRMKGVKRKFFCPHQIRSNYMSAHKIIKYMCSIGGAVPEDVQYLLDMIEFEPNMSEIYHKQACLVPLCSIAPYFTKMFEQLLRFMTDLALVDKILLEIPYVGTDQELMSLHFPAALGAAVPGGSNVWHHLFQTNSILEKTYNYPGGRHLTLQPLQVLQGQVAITPQQLRERRLLEARHLLNCLRNRVCHRMDYQGLFQYTAKASDLATHARFSKVNCVLQKELHIAKQTEQLGLDEFVLEKV